MLRLTQRVSGWLLLAASLVLVASGLGWYNLGFFRRLSFNPHVRIDVFMSIFLIIHVGISSKIALKRARIAPPSINLLVASGMLLLLLTGVYIDGTLGQLEKETGDPDTSSVPDIPDVPGAPDGPENTTNQGEEKPPGNVSPLPGIDYDTRPEREGRIRVGSETYTFNPDDVNTTRPDIFNPGYFSMFDVLVHVAEKGYIDLEYHFDESMNTHVVDSVDGEEDWWYMAFYDGGWSEKNFFRPDHYPWKDGTTLRFFKVKRDTLDLAYDIFRKEVARKRGVEGKVVVPRVVIDGPTTQKEFKNVEVTAHNLRDDVFQSGVITAIDVILSLSDQGKLTYGLQWYESIGTAGVVKNYWVESIDEDVAHHRCGFVYESGSNRVRGFAGNHIHLPSDTRALNSPEYVLYFWICL